MRAAKTAILQRRMARAFQLRFGRCAADPGDQMTIRCCFRFFTVFAHFEGYHFGVRRMVMFQY